MKPPRRIIRNPGIVKRQRMAVCLHESAHALAFQKLCGVRARCVVYLRGGGVCSHPAIPDARLNEEMIALACGRVGESLHALVPIPAGRYRKIRPSRRHATRRTDNKTLSLYTRYAEVELSQKIDTAAIQNEAENFVTRHQFEIVALAEKLFHFGEVSLPARPRDRESYQWYRPPLQAF